MDAEKLVKEGPPQGKEHHHPKMYYEGVLKGACLVADECAKDVILNELARVILYYENLFMCAMQCLFEFKILPSVQLFIKSERWPVVGFCPHATSAGVFGINLSTLFPIVGSFEGVCSAQRTRQSDYNGLSLSLSHRNL